MRVLLLNYEFPPLGGGAGNATYHLLEELINKNGLEIDLVTSSSGVFHKKIFSKNITGHFLDINKKEENFHHQSIKDLLIYFLKAFFYSRNLLKQKNYDLIHAFFGVPCGLIALLLNKPYIVSLRGSDVPYFNQRFYWIDRLFIKRLSRQVWKKSAAVIANSQGLKELALKTALNQKIMIIPNGTDTDFFRPGKAKKQNAILFVGRLIQRKGIDLLIRAFSRLPRSFKEGYELWVAGDGPQKEKLLKLAAELKVEKNIKIMGRKSRQEVKKMFQQAKLFVLPSYNEGMSNALLQALASGLPVIFTNTGGSAELVDKDNGITVNKGSIKELVTAMEQILGNETRQKSMGIASRQKSEKMSWKKMVQGYQKIYQFYA